MHAHRYAIEGAEWAGRDGLKAAPWVLPLGMIGKRDHSCVQRCSRPSHTRCVCARSMLYLLQLRGSDIQRLSGNQQKMKHLLHQQTAKNRWSTTDQHNKAASTVLSYIMCTNANRS